MFSDNINIHFRKEDTNESNPSSLSYQHLYSDYRPQTFFWGGGALVFQCLFVYFAYFFPFYLGIKHLYFLQMCYKPGNKVLLQLSTSDERSKDTLNLAGYVTWSELITTCREQRVRRIEQCSKKMIPNQGCLYVGIYFASGVREDY